MIACHTSAWAQFLANTQTLGVTAGMPSLGRDAEVGVDYEYCAASSKIAGGLGIGGLFRYYNNVSDGPNFSNKLDRYTFGITGEYHPLIGSGRFDPEFGFIVGYEYWTLYRTSNFPAVSPDSTSNEPRLSAGVSAGVRVWMNDWLAFRLRVFVGDSYSLIGYNNILTAAAVPTAALELGIDFGIQPSHATPLSR